MNRYHWLALGVLLLAPLGCQRSETPPAEPSAEEELNPVRAQMSPEVRAQLDSGTQAFREKDYEGALRHYQKVTELSGHLPAGWYGVYMAQQALGDSVAAQAALRRSQALSPAVSPQHPVAGDTTP